MKRKSLKRSSDRKVFRKTSGAHPANTIRFVMRGGIRK